MLADPLPDLRPTLIVGQILRRPQAAAKALDLLDQHAAFEGARFLPSDDSPAKGYAAVISDRRLVYLRQPPRVPWVAGI